MADQRPIKTIPEMSETTDIQDDDLFISYTEALGLEQKASPATIAAAVAKRGGIKSLNSIADMEGFTGVEGQQVHIAGYHPDSTDGGGIFVWDTGKHNGGTFIDPNRTFPTPAQWAAGSSDPAVIAWFDTSGGTVDGWERTGKAYLSTDMFGGFAPSEGASAFDVRVQRIVANATDDTGTPDALVKVDREHAQPNSGHSFVDQTVFNPTADNVAFAGYDFNVDTAAVNTRPMDHMVAFQSRLQHFSSGTLTDYSAVWALDRIESGATCTNLYPFYDQSRTEGTTVDHYSFVSEPIINGNVTNRVGVRIKQHLGSGNPSNINVGAYIDELTGGTVYPVFVEMQPGTAWMGCKTDFQNQVTFRALFDLRTDITPDADATRDIGTSSRRIKTFHATTVNSTILNLEPQSTAPSSVPGTLAISDGSGGGFDGSSGAGLYRRNSAGTAWVFIG